MIERHLLQEMLLKKRHFPWSSGHSGHHIKVLEQSYENQSKANSAGPRIVSHTAKKLEQVGGSPRLFR